MECGFPMRSPVEVIVCLTLVVDKILCIPHGVPTGEDEIVLLYARQENCEKLFVMQWKTFSLVSTPLATEEQLPYT